MIDLGCKTLESLRPDGGWIIYGDDFDSILWISCEPVNKEDFSKEFERQKKLYETPSL